LTWPSQHHDKWGWCKSFEAQIFELGAERENFWRGFDLTFTCNTQSIKNFKKLGFLLHKFAECYRLDLLEVRSVDDDLFSGYWSLEMERSRISLKRGEEA
jgi:hypothetical protein